MFHYYGMGKNLWDLKDFSKDLTSLFLVSLLWSLAVFWRPLPSVPSLNHYNFDWGVSLNKNLCYYLRGTFVSLSTIMKISLSVQSWFFKIRFSAVLWFPEKHTAKFLPVHTYYRIIVLLFLKPWGGFMNLISSQVCFYKVSCSTLNQT